MKSEVVVGFYGLYITNFSIVHSPCGQVVDLLENTSSSIYKRDFLKNSTQS